MRKVLTFILNIFFGKSIDKQEQEYITKYGYPKDDKIFIDNRGRISRLIGTNTYKKVTKLSKKIKIGNR